MNLVGECRIKLALSPKPPIESCEGALVVVPARHKPLTNSIHFPNVSDSFCLLFAF
jgi:hypothetical protein